MKMCEEYAALLDMYVDGFCADEEAARVRAHLTVCEGCRMYVEQILQMKEAFPDAEETEVPEGFAEGVMAEIRAQAAPRKKTMKPWQKTLLQMAACIAVVIALGPLSEQLAGRGGGSAAPEAAMLDMSKTSYSTASSASGGTTATADSVSAVSESADDSKAEAPAAYDTENNEAGVPGSVPTGGVTEPSAAPETAQYARKLKVRLTESRRQELLSGYAGTASDDGAFTYVLSAAEFDAVLAKIPAGDIVPGSEQENDGGKNCCLIVYPAR